MNKRGAEHFDFYYISA